MIVYPYFIKGTNEERDAIIEPWWKMKPFLSTNDNFLYVWNGSQWIKLGGEGGATSWGIITGTLSEQSDLGTALNDKLGTAHTADYDHSLIHSNSQDHSHSNKSTLDTYDQTNVNITGAISHAGSAHAPSNAQKNSDITKAEIEAKLTGEISSHTHAGGGGESETVVVATQTTANATTTLANATGLAFAALANSTYLIEGYIVWTTSVATVGIKLSATGPATPTLLAGHFTTDAINGTPDGSSFNANDVTVTTSASAFTTGNIAALHCILKTGAGAGNFQIRFAAETTGTVTIQIGSCLRYRKIA